MIKYSDEKTGADAKLFESGDLFLSGTFGKIDILQDLKISTVKAYGAEGHKGAYEQAVWLRDNVDWEKVKEIYTATPLVAALLSGWG